MCLFIKIIIFMRKNKNLALFKDETQYQNCCTRKAGKNIIDK